MNNMRAPYEDLDSKPLAFCLSGGELLLLHQTLAGAFALRLSSFATRIGMTKLEARRIMDRFKALMEERSKDDDLLPIGDFDLVFSTTETQAFRNALELVMRDFGQDEFFTRTGFDLAEGAQMIDKLNAALIAPLHIEHRGNGSAHSQVAQSR